MSTRHSIPRLLALGLLAGAPARAQSPSRSPAAAGATIPERQLVQVHTADGARFYGRLLGRTGDSLTLSGPTLDGQRSVAWASIDTLWVQHGTAAVPMGLFGAGAFGVFTAMLARDFSGMNDGPPCRTRCMAGSAVAGAGVGFMLGAALGSVVPRWRVRWAAQHGLGR
jgi:hypothetical protein